MIRRERESILFQPVREDFPSPYAFRAQFSHFSLSLTSPSGRKYITNVVKLGDIGRSRNSSRRGKRKYLSFAIQILLSAIEIDMNSAPRKALTDPL